MPAQYVLNAQKFIPATADGVLCIPNGVAWNWGNYVQITPSAVEAGILTEINFRNTAVAQMQFEIEIAKGLAGFEVPIGTIRGGSYTVSGGNDPCMWPYHVGINGWNAGDRLSARVRVSDTSLDSWYVSIGYYIPPISGTFQTTTKPSKVLPSGSLLFVTTPIIGIGVYWVFGNYTQISASLPTDIGIIGIVAQPWTFNGNNDFEIGLAFGAGGAEVDRYTFRGYVGSFAGQPWWQPFTIPLKFNAGERLSARVRNNGWPGLDYAIALIYHELPL